MSPGRVSARVFHSELPAPAPAPRGVPRPRTPGAPRPGSAAGERRRAPLGCGGDALADVLRRQRDRLRQPLPAQGVLERGVPAVPQRLRPSAAWRPGPRPPPARRRRAPRPGRASAGTALRGQAQPDGLLAVHDAAGEQQVAGHGDAGDLGQGPGGRHTGVQAQGGERDAHPGRRGDVPDVAGERDGEAGADRRPVDRRDGGHLQVADRSASRGRTPASGGAAAGAVASRSPTIQDRSPPALKAGPVPVTTTAASSGSSRSAAISRHPGRRHRPAHRVAALRQVEAHHRDAPPGGLPQLATARSS